MPAIGPIELLVVQPTPFCNLDCSYCYLPDRDNRRRMDLAIVEAIGRHILASPHAAAAPTVVWHAGEPMTVPPAWYDRAFETLARAAPGCRVTHAFQTNGTLITERWADLWAKWNVVVGVSLDGPQALHDSRRRTRRGGGSFAATMRGIRLLQDRGFPFHVISVVTMDALRDPARLLDFFLDQGITDLCFSIEEIEGGHRMSSLGDPGAIAAYASLVRHVAARQDAGAPAFACRETDGVRQLVLATPEQRRANDQVRPLAIVSVAVDGGMSTFSPEFLGHRDSRYQDFLFGNVREGGPELILRNPGFRRLKADIDAGVAACRAACGYFDVCAGGAPANKYFELGTCRGAETLYCRIARKTVLEEVLAHLEDGAGLPRRAPMDPARCPGP